MIYVAGVIAFMLGVVTGHFVSVVERRCRHDWEYLGEHAGTYQQKKCRKCNKLMMESQF